MSEKTIGTLVLDARAGDASAFEELYYRTSPQMMGLAMSMLKQEQDAMDVLQDSYVYAFGKLSALEQPESFPGWLYRLVANRCKNFLTRTRPKLFAASLTEQEGGDWDFADVDDALQPEESVDTAETRRLVMDMVDALPEDQRACVLLFYFQDMKVSEIAQLLEVSENTVKSRLNYARKKLRVQAEELERRGTVLHGVAIVPLLRLAFAAGVEEQCAVSAAAVFQGVAESLGIAGATVAGGAASAGATAATAAGTTATGTAASGGLTVFLGTVAGKVVLGVAAAAVVATAGYVATRPAPLAESAVVEPAPEASELQEPSQVMDLAAPEEPVRDYVFDERFGDQFDGLPFEEFHLRLSLSGAVEVTDYDLERGTVHLLMRRGEQFVLEQRGVGEGVIHIPMQEKDLLAMVNLDDVTAQYGWVDGAIVCEAIEPGVMQLTLGFDGDDGGYVELFLYICIAEEDGSLPAVCWPHVYYEFLSGFRFVEEGDIFSAHFVHDNIDPESVEDVPEFRVILAVVQDLERGDVPGLYLAESYGGYMDAVFHEYRIRDGEMVLEGYAAAMHAESYPGWTIAEADLRDGPGEMNRLLERLERAYDSP